MFVRYPPGKIRYEGDRPVALLAVPVAPSFRLVNLPLGLPTTSARTSRGTWALYPIGAEVVVVHPDGAVSGPATEVAAEVGRLATLDRQGGLDRRRPRPCRSRPAGGEDLDHPGQGLLAERPRQPPRHVPTEAPTHARQRPSVTRGTGGPTMHAGSPPGRSQPTGSRQPLPERGMRPRRHGRRGIHERG